MKEAADNEQGKAANKRQQIRKLADQADNQGSCTGSSCTGVATPLCEAMSSLLPQVPAHSHFFFTSARVCSWLSTRVAPAMPTTIRVSSAYGKSSGRRSKLLQVGVGREKRGGDDAPAQCSSRFSYIWRITWAAKRSSCSTAQELRGGAACRSSSPARQGAPTLKERTWRA